MPSSLALDPMVNGDRRDAFTALFRAHWPAVHAYARRRTLDAEAAHDIAAETFTVAWRRFDEIPSDHVLQWLYRTAAYVVANTRRGGRRRERLAAKLDTEPRDRASGPADEIVEDLALFEAFDSLREDDREILRLVAWEGLTNADIARVLDVSTNAAALRVSRARSRLDEALATASGPPGHEMGDHPGTTGTQHPADGRSEDGSTT